MNGDLGRVGLRMPHVGIGMEDLPLEVRIIDRVEVDDAHSADPCGGQIHGDGRTQTARPDTQDGGVADLALTGQANFWKDQMAGVSANLLIGELKHTTGIRVGPCTPTRKKSLGFGEGSRESSSATGIRFEIRFTISELGVRTG